MTCFGAENETQTRDFNFGRNLTDADASAPIRLVSICEGYLFTFEILMDIDLLRHK